MAAPAAPNSVAIFEIVRMGAVARVTALDPVTLTEVSLQGPAGAADAHLRHLAAQKLARAVARVRQPSP